MSRILTFTRRPIEVQAIQLREDAVQNVVSIIENHPTWWNQNYISIHRANGKLEYIRVNTPDGDKYILPNEWVIWGADWVCCPQILNDTDFETRYEYKPLEFGPGRSPYTVKTE
jgi:hypothetical protein